LVGLLVGVVIGTISYVGFKNTGSPTLFRISIAFFAIGIGFGILATGFILDDFILFLKLEILIEEFQLWVLPPKQLDIGLLHFLILSKLSFPNQDILDQ
jgi:hypothetical protein